ncbi:MAG: DNA-binding transcriptional regulator [Bacteroidaceae bacterium]
MIRLILLTDFTELYAYELLRGILHYAKEHQEPWVVSRMPSSLKERLGIAGVIDWALRWQADAIIGQFNEQDAVEEFARHGIVAIAQDYKSRFQSIPNITSDYCAAGKMAAEYFLNRGFKNFAFCGYHHVVWSEERCQGFKERILAEGGNCSYSEYKNQQLEDLWFYDSQKLNQWLSALPLPVAIFVCGDNQGNKVSEACRIANLKLPEEVSVLGVDDDDTICTLADPQLSSIHMNVANAGYETAKRIKEQLEQSTPILQDIYVTHTHIVTRRSTDIFATEDKEIAKAIKYIHDNMHRLIGVDDVLQQVPLSRRLLEIRFKRITRKSIYHYIFTLKMQCFTQLLLTTDRPINELAAEIGLADGKNISRQFKSLHQCTPVDYRKRYKLNPFK